MPFNQGPQLIGTTRIQVIKTLSRHRIAAQIRHRFILRRPAGAICACCHPAHNPLVGGGLSLSIYTASPSNYNINGAATKWTVNYLAPAGALK